MKMKMSVFVLFAIGLAGMLSGCHTTTYKNTSAPVELTMDQKDGLAYMWNEEKLAYDVYIELNSTYPAKQFSMISAKELEHRAVVETLVETYDINITNLVDYTEHYSKEELEALAPGEFAIDELQQAYDDFIIEGNVSKKAALSIGCKVEVKDINDLTGYMALFEGIDDVVMAFSALRDQSQMHYNAFNSALADLNVTDGCCNAMFSPAEDYCLAP